MNKASLFLFKNAPEDKTPRKMTDLKTEFNSAMSLLDALPRYVEVGDYDSAHSMLLGSVEIYTGLSDRNYSPARIERLGYRIRKMNSLFESKWPM